MPPLAAPTAVTAALVAFLAASSASASAADYVQTRGSALSFATQYDGMTFTGRFPDFSTTFTFDPDDLASARLDVSIPLGTTTTGNRDRDSMLKTVDFFNLAQFAVAHYTASSFRALEDGRYAADGILELKGIGKPVTLTFTWTPADTHNAPAVLSGQATIRRLEFAVGSGDWSDTATIPDEVAIATKVRLRPAS